MTTQPKSALVTVLEISANQESDEVRLAAFCCGSSSSAVSASITTEANKDEQEDELAADA